MSTVAQAMVEDAVSYHQKREEAGSEGATAQSQEVMVANNSVINQLCQSKVRLHGIKLLVNILYTTICTFAPLH